MADNALNIQENLCEAINIIANANVNKVKFDSTIECTIIDDSDKLIGKYKVKNESYAEFYAYSQITTYSNDDKVYVQIPKGDYNNTKFIVGKKTDKNEDKPYNFVNPFSTFIDLTGNFYQSKDNNKEIWSILANGDQNEIELTPEGGITFTDEQQGYTRLGLRADFRAWLEALGVKTGNYGLKIDIYGTKNNTAENLESDQLIETVRLDTSDMYGNPYNFEGYYSQEIIIDISEVAKISKIKIYLYQSNNFKDENNNLITYDSFGNLSVPPNNIFVKDIYMGLGIATDEVENEYVRLYSLDGSTYVISSDGTMNKKNIILKWVHFNDNNEKEQILELPEGCNIYWYQYEFGAPSADEYSGVYWNKLDNNDKFSYELIPRSNKAQEQLKVIILYNNKVYRSNIITFSNEKEVPNDATIDSLNALSLVCKDNSNGNYLIYNQANYLSNRSDSKIERELTLHFTSKTYNIDSDFTNESNILVEAQKVVWYVPADSMLSFNNYEGTVSGNYLVKEINNPTVEDFTLTYTIGPFYSANKSNNTVIAKITKDNIEYTAIKTFTFGQAGTNGTDCTLVIDMISHERVDNKILTAIKSGTPQARDTYYFKAQLYDNQGKEVNDFSGVSWKWSLNKQVANFTIEDATSQICKIRVNTQSSLMNLLMILSVELKGWGDYDLQASYPIPFTTKDNTYINGTTEVIYLSDGTPTFNKEPYVLYQNGKKVENVVWSIIPTANTTFIGTINNKDGQYRLNPLSFYVKNADQYGVQATVDNEVVWTQPILVLQNKYPSAMVNKWDGKALLDSESNFLGVAQIAAGKKESDNTFTGVLMGDFGTKQSGDSSISYKTGIYGYNKGQQVYSLTDDGKATFGKRSNGQIIIDGDNSKIQTYDFKYVPANSSTKESTVTGMCLDLKASKIYCTDGVFSGDIRINYDGSTGNSWYDNYYKETTEWSLNDILNTIGSAAKQAKEAADAAADVAQTAASISIVANNAAANAQSAVNDLDYLSRILNYKNGSNIYLGPSADYSSTPNLSIFGGTIGLMGGTGNYLNVTDKSIYLQAAKINLNSSDIMIYGTNLDTYIANIVQQYIK